MSKLPTRILKETARLAQDPVMGIHAEPSPDNARWFHVLIEGPPETPFEGAAPGYWGETPNAN